MTWDVTQCQLFSVTYIQMHPWKTTKLNELMEQRDRIKLLAQKKRCKDLYNEYKKLRNNVNSAIRKSKAEYYKSLIQENINKPDRLWKAIKEALPSGKKTETSSHINR